MPRLAAHLPGNPTIVIDNVPGAGALAGANRFQQRGKPDGTDVFAASASVTLNFAFRNPGANYELDKWKAFASTAVGTVVYARTDIGIEKAEDIAKLRDINLLLGGNNPTGGDLRTLLSLDLLGIKVQPVFGMNRGEIYSAFDRGEFNINFDTITAYEAQVIPMVEQGNVVPLFSLGFIDDEGNYGRDPAVPDLPSFMEVYENLHGEPLSGPAYDAWMSIFGLNVMASRALMLPEGVSDEIFDIYTAAMEAVMDEIEADPELRARAFEWLRNWAKETLNADL